MKEARCSELSLAARERLAATATHVEQWLVLEVPGSWPRDVAAGSTLPAGAAAALAAWRVAASEGAPRRVLFVRRPERSRGSLLAFVVTAGDGHGEVRRIALAEHAELDGLDLETAGDAVDASLVLICGHGSRDACCALHGTAVFAALSTSLGHEELWISSHQGGHPFAANVLVLPAGVQLGRVQPVEAPAVVGRALAGEIDLDRYRGRTVYAPVVQAAEHAIRLAEGLTRIDDLRLIGIDGTDGLVHFRGVDGRERAAVVESADGPVIPASCGAPPEPQEALAARVVR
ncbi:MAG: sucrase ferredoxin [Gaiellaceae bacterium]